MHLLRADQFKGKHVRKEGDELVFHCPSCRRDKLYVNPTMKKFVCFRCGIHGRVTGDWGAVAHRRPTDALKQKLLEDDLRIPPNKPLGAEARGYLQSRGFGQATIDGFILSQGLDGAWVGRIIIPIFEGGTPVYYFGRSYRRRDKRPRYMYPRGVRRSDKLLFNFTSRVGRAVIVEGWTDVARLAQVGIPGIALLGKSLSPAQKEKVLDRVSSSVVVCLDSDAWASGVTIAERLSPYLSTRVKLLDRGDVGDASKATLTTLTKELER